MNETAIPPNRPVHDRLFYSLASITLLVATLIGFRLFYLHLQAFPGRPLTPPIRTLLIIHGTLMTLWMLLSVVQPLLVATGRKRVHMTLGKLAAVLAMGIVVAGYLVAVNAARMNPPEMRLFGLAPKEFLTVPLCGIVTFAVFVGIGVGNRRRPEIHRPMMLMASLAIVAAALGRMPQLNDWYAGTRLEYWFSAFVTTLALGAVMLLVKCALEKRFDRWFAIAYGLLVAACMTASLVAKTGQWGQLASVLTH
jgi:hypothetical protein